MRYVLTLLILLTTVSLNAQIDLQFSWMSGKQVVGELNIHSKEKNDATIYEYYSSIHVNVGIDMKLQEAWRVTYADETLQTFTVENSFDGKTRVSISESANEEGILRLTNGKEKLIDREELKYSYILLFIKEPVGLTQVYSELYGSMFTIEESGKQTYTITDSRNRIQKFEYDEDGNLKKAEIEMSVGEFTLVPLEGE